MNNKCLNCGKIVKNKFCSRSCIIIFYNKKKRWRQLNNIDKIKLLKIFKNGFSLKSLDIYCKEEKIPYKSSLYFLKKQKVFSKYENKYCEICKCFYNLLGLHYLNKKDIEHNKILEQQKQIALKALKNGLSEYDHIEGFIFSGKMLRKFWKEKFSIIEIRNMRKKFKYKKNTFICKKCNSKFVQRQTNGTCKICLKKLRTESHKCLGTESHKCLGTESHKCLGTESHKCLECEKDYIGKKKSKFCSRKCQQMYNRKKKHSLERRKRQSESLKKQYKNGRIQAGGKTKWYDYNSLKNGKIRVQGTFEQTFCHWMDENNLDWKKNNIRFEYVNENNNSSTYLPDFWINDFKCFVEVKGWWNKNSLLKKEQFKQKIAYIEAQQIELIRKKAFKLEDFKKLIY